MRASIFNTDRRLLASIPSSVFIALAVSAESTCGHAIDVAAAVDGFCNEALHLGVAVFGSTVGVVAWGWMNEVENRAKIREFCCVCRFLKCYSLRGIEFGADFVDVRCIGSGGKEGRKEPIGLR